MNRVDHSKLLALRRLPITIESAASAARRLQGVQRGTARVQTVRRVRRELREALQGADRRGSSQEG